ncbi:DUF4747 family protein [Methylobacterium durans]|uniref:DUF4747 family protein n=1 Tax=Methylobacterium durans TaxID=2202825 RepID=UPI002AFE25C8|nr:DUF4747 family protein [Methylobacterium durans]MEA1830938.1 DUF4747 family protein [Methylobacterium durans]
MPRPSRGKQIVLGALNITADPHPEGVYQRLLEMAADREIEVWGSDYAKITKPKPRRSDPNVLTGEILVWTVVDRQGEWIDKETNAKATPDRMREIRIPDPLEPNFRAFSYAFVLNRHRLVYEMRNEFGHNFGHTRADRFFRELFSREVLGSDQPEVSVTVIPEDDTVQKILALPKLKTLEIHLSRPNPDDLEDDTARLLDELESQGAKSQTIILKKAPKIPSLTPNDTTQRLALVASENGYVSARGVDAEGNPVEESTKRHPKSVPVDVPPDSSARIRFLSAVFRLL